MCRLYVITFLLLLLTILPTFAQDDACVVAEDSPIRIGAVFPQGSLLTVRVAEHYQGAEAIRQAINDCGGVNGHPVEWVYMPASDRQEAIEAATTLIDDENIMLIVGSGSLAVLDGLQSVTEEANVVLWEVSEPLTNPGEWTFSPRPTHQQLGAATVAFMTTTLQESLELDELRVALIYEDRPRGQAVANAILDNLPTEPILEIAYSNNLDGRYDIAETIREEGINVVLLGSFDSDADRLWYALRDADANPAAWIHVGSSGYREGLCNRFGNYDGFLSVSATGPIDEDYREAVTDGIDRLYRRAYIRENSEEPTQRADLSASGVYMLLRHVLPNVNGDLTAKNIRTTIIETSIDESVGLMGEGLMMESGVNQHPGVIVQQRQNGAFCSSWPGDIATCSVAVMPFPTWRERAIASENETCRDDSA